MLTHVLHAVGYGLVFAAEALHFDYYDEVKLGGYGVLTGLALVAASHAVTIYLRRRSRRKDETKQE